MVTIPVGTQRHTASPFFDSNQLLGAPNELRRRAQEDGYLFFRGLVSHQAIDDLRRDITGILEEAGWLDDGTDPMEAISTADAKIIGTPEFNPVYDAIQRLESFQTMAHREEILDVAAALLGEPPMPQPSTIVRAIFANAPEHTTPAHQDYVLVQGTPEVWTCWIPLGACPHELGGLAVLRGSHRRGVLPVSEALGAGGVAVNSDALTGEWLTSPFELGDALLFHSKTVHLGLPNLTADRVRLSVDYRYQKKTDPITEVNLGVHQGRLTWEQVYEHWESDEYQYYWRGHERESVRRVPVDEFMAARMTRPRGRQ